MSSSSSENMVVTIEKVYEAMHSQLMWAIGIMVGILATGGLTAFGISCIFLLFRNQDPETLKQRRLLLVYIVVLLLFVTSFIIVDVLWCNVAVIFYFHSPRDEAERSDTLVTFFGNLTPVFVVAMTDGLLVWRCYMIQKLPLRYDPSWWQNIFWIFPAFLWSLTMVTGCVAAPLVLVPSQKPEISNAKNALQAAALFSNVILNVYATMFISIRLLNHKIMMVRLAGQKVDTSRYANIVSILLESAAINVPITIAVAIGIGIEADFGIIVVPIAITGQAFASVVIIHQVAAGRAFNRRQEEELSQFTAEKRSSGNHPRPTDASSLNV